MTPIINGKNGDVSQNDSRQSHSSIEKVLHTCKEHLFMRSIFDICVSQFQLCISGQYSPETSENLCFSDVFRGYTNGTLT